MRVQPREYRAVPPLKMAHPAGFEPATPGFVDRCSNPAELRVRKGALLSGQGHSPSRKHEICKYGAYNRLVSNTPPQTLEETDRNAEKRFHGWRLLGYISCIVVVLAVISAVVDWAVIGPLEGRAF
jgi:hypothetical protein